MSSFVRVDIECALPLENLKETPEEVLDFELQSKSLQHFHHDGNGRPTLAAPEQSRPIM